MGGSFVGVPVLPRETTNLNRSQITSPQKRLEAKRVVDVGLALVFLLGTLPVLGLAMLAIGLSGGGPTIFRQKRIGYQGREFIILKLRTMRKGKPPKSSGRRVFDKVQGDERVTLIGRFLRKYSIDELPQFINVLRGEMSIVGPRPLLLRDMENFPRGTPMRRFEVKPGITGLWQVSGRNDLTDAERIQLDLDYVEGWTPWLDISILLRTPLAVLISRGAF